MKQTSNAYKPMLENSLNLTNYSFFEQGYEAFQQDVMKNGSIFNLDEADISLLNALNYNNNNPKTNYPVYSSQSQPKVEISSTLKDIDDLLTRLKPIKDTSKAQPPLPTVKNVNINNLNMNINNNMSNNNNNMNYISNMNIVNNINKNNNNSYSSSKQPYYPDNVSNRSNTFRRGINYWDIPFIGNDSFNERKTSSDIWAPAEKDLEVFLLERNFKLKQITKFFYSYLSLFDLKTKNSKKFKIFSAIYKYYLSIISNDGNSIGLYCDIRQIEKYLGEFIDSMASELLDLATVRIWMLSLRGLSISKEKHNKIKAAMKGIGSDNTNNLSMTANSLTYGNEMESIENIESDEEFDNE